MKYIRTKDNRIIEFTPKQKYENDKTTFDWFVANYCGGGINVSKVADTIEELIDEKVLIQKGGYPTLLETIEFNKNIYLRINEYEFATQLPSNPIIYGAIWTDKGLIYVAKMKGILPNGEIDWELL